MAIGSRTWAIGSAAALSAYASDITDNPLTGLVSTGIGVGVGSLLVLPKPNLETRVFNGATVDESRIEALAVTGKSREQSTVDTRFKTRINDIGILVNKPKTSKELRELNVHHSNMLKIGDVLEKYGIVVPKTFTDAPAIFLKQLSQIDDPTLQKRLLPLLAGNQSHVVNTSVLTDVRSKKVRNVIANSTDTQSRIDKLSQVLQDHLGNSVNEANRKAALIVARSVGDIEIVNGTANFVDKANSKSVNLPLTSYDANGVRYHNAGNGNVYSVKGFTPFLERFVNNSSYVMDGKPYVPTLNQVKMGMAPEMMIGFLGEDTPISSLLPEIKSFMNYNANETGAVLSPNYKVSSPTLINDSSTVRTDKVLNLDFNDGVNRKKPFRDIGLTADKQGVRSEHARLMSQYMLIDKDAASTTYGVSNNSTTDMQSAKGTRTLSLLPPLERNLTGSTIRDTVPMEKTTGAKIVQSILAPVGGDVLYSSSQVVSKLDVLDQETFNKFSVDLLGDNSKVLADGYGAYNRRSWQKFAITGNKSLRFPLSADTIVQNEKLKDAIESGNVGKWINDNGNIPISNKPIGYTPAGLPVTLGNQFTSGEIIGAFINNNNELVLNAQGRFNPNLENEVKFHSIGSKSLMTGIQGDLFEMQATFGKLLNEGKITYEGGLIKSTGISSVLEQYIGSNGISIDDYKKLFNHQPFVDSIAVKDIDMITSSRNTGMKHFLTTFKDLMSGTPASAELADVSGLNEMMKIKGVDPKSAFLASYLTLESKGSEDLTAHVAKRLIEPLMNLKNGTASSADLLMIQQLNKYKLTRTKLTERSGVKAIDNAITRVTDAFRDRTTVQKFFGKTKEQYYKSLYELVHLSRAASDVFSGVSSAIGTSGLGNSIVGANNSARMSWNAYHNLLKSGLTPDQLKMFGAVDQDLVYEAQGILNESKKSNGSFRDAIAGKESQVEFILKDAAPEERLSRLRTLIPDLQMDNGYLKYQLSHTVGDIKELNFSLLTSSRSGKFSVEERELLKQLDRERLKVFNADLEYRGAVDPMERKDTKERLSKALIDYEDMHKGILKGSFLKNTLSLYSETSGIKVANPIGGDAQAYTEAIERDANGKYKDIARHVFMSSQGVEGIAEDLNINEKDIVRQRIAGTSLNVVGYNDAEGKFVPFTHMLTREPATGIYSSQFLDIIEDTSIKGGKTSVYFTEGQYGVKVGASMDYDQDTFQGLYKKLSRDQYDEVTKVTMKLGENHKPFLDVEEAMSPKGSAKNAYSLGSFTSLDELNEHLMTADIKGKVRKVYAPMATSLSLKYASAIDLEYGDDINAKTLGRIANYRIVENLIKSSHIDTSDFKGATMAIDELNLAREAFIKDGNTSKYGAVMDKHLPSVLGADHATGSTKDVIDQAVGLIKQSELNQAHNVENSFQHYLDMDKSHGINAAHRSAEEIMGSMDMFENEKVLDVKRTPQQLYRGINNAIVDTFRSNKGLIGAGIAALVGVNLLGRSEPSFADSRSHMRMPADKMISPTATVENGIETNPTASVAIEPQMYTAGTKAVGMAGEYLYNTYNPFNSSLDSYDATNSANQSLNNSIFGGGLRSARLDITDL